MIEEGVVLLVQANAAVAAICSVGGFFVELPKGTARPSWIYKVVSDVSDTTVAGETGFTMRRLQIDCFGDTSAQVIALAKAINNALGGFRGTLTDPDHTKVDSTLTSDTMDFFDDASRTYRRMIEFEIWFYEN